VNARATFLQSERWPTGAGLTGAETETAVPHLRTLRVHVETEAVVPRLRWAGLRARPCAPLAY
jgi:hypothetical protein